MRPIAAAAVALALVTVIAVLSPAKAQDANGQCVAKDQVIAEVSVKVGTEGLHFRKVTDAAAKIVGADMAANNISDVGSSYVLFWKDGKENTAILVAIFDEHNCFNRYVKGPRDAVLKLVEGVGA